MTPEEITYLTNAIGHDPTDYEQKLYLRLKLYLNREPIQAECINMMTDTNLAMWVLTGT